MRNIVPPQSEDQPVFKILKIRPTKPDGAIKAYADIEVQELTICGLKIIQKKTGGHFVGWPASRSPGKNGAADKWFPVVECKEPLQSHIANSVLEEARNQGVIL